MKEHDRNISYVNRTATNVDAFHKVIVEAMRNGGEFPEEYADIFTLTDNPEGIRCAWILNFREDD